MLNLSQHTLEALGLAPLDWEFWWERQSSEVRNLVEKELSALAQKAVHEARYFAARNLGHKHSRAVLKANSAITATRRALKYAYPSEGEINF